MIRIGIICPSEIALRRFLPALCQSPEFVFAGVAIASLNEWEGANEDIIQKEREKATYFIELYGGKIFDSYTSIIESSETDAIYLPLPPALHYQWAKLALLSNKHVLVEKPFTTSHQQTYELISIATSNKLALHENYMFVFHNQLKAIDEVVQNGEIGIVRLYRIAFGFPRRASNDFRYNKHLGGGALLDCGGYTIKYASMLLGDTARIICARSNDVHEFEVDLFGSVTMINEDGVTAQIAFGMDNYYKCDLEVWGSTGNLTSGRVLTAPAGFIPEMILKKGDKTEIRSLPTDDAFYKSIMRFKECIECDAIREDNYRIINKQSELIEAFREKANK